MDRKIFVVSDATGSTAEHVLKAALAQFEATDVLIERRPQTRTVEDIRKVVDEAQQTGALNPFEDARQAYIDAQTVQQEVAYSDEIFKHATWPVVDMTLKSLEEVATEVVSLATDLPYTRTPSEP